MCLIKQSKTKKIYVDIENEVHSIQHSSLRMVPNIIITSVIFSQTPLQYALRMPQYGSNENYTYLPRRQPPSGDCGALGQWTQNDRAHAPSGYDSCQICQKPEDPVPTDPSIIHHSCPRSSREQSSREACTSNRMSAVDSRRNDSWNGPAGHSAKIVSNNRGSFSFQPRPLE